MRGVVDRLGEGGALEHVDLVGLDGVRVGARPAGVVGQVVVGVLLDLGGPVASERGVPAEPVAVALPGVRRLQAVLDRLEADERRLGVGGWEGEAAVDEHQGAD